MPRPFTLFTGQWADLPLEEVCRLARDFGYDGLELACWGDHFEVDKALADPSYLDGRHAAARQVRPEVLGDLQPPGRPGRLRRHHRRAPPGASCPPVSGATASPRAYGSGPPPRSTDTARAAAAFGVDTVIGFTGSVDLAPGRHVPARAPSR